MYTTAATIILLVPIIISTSSYESPLRKIHTLEGLNNITIIIIKFAMLGSNESSTIITYIIVATHIFAIDMQ